MDDGDQERPNAFFIFAHPILAEGLAVLFSLAAVNVEHEVQEKSLRLFAGFATDSTGTQGYLNDPWRYTPGVNGQTGEWTWMGGSSTIPQAYGGQPGVYGTLGTPASTNDPGGRFSAVSWIDGSGNLWFFGGDGYDSTGAQIISTTYGNSSRKGVEVILGGSRRAFHRYAD